MRLRSPCLDCDKVDQDKNKCLESCEKLKEFQEMIAKQGVYARV
ncbi:hypothetical protein SAMN02746041_01115 [Desulfacinum hydrothermale DSM 13146]|uniref:Uncharacterized protein n=1 Tax=Desulfacinum hydrothermale DSM 13146 TaxID=1121390 RepID=A0A1W1XAW5_9BACT|nr:hypothetical protein [Desulfacinum hydrothermale]SMC21062.1 hypothetical protein SAMN02746041_01115 [Desulfacinum hydrothermale DSM 13146]